MLNDTIDLVQEYKYLRIAKNKNNNNFNFEIHLLPFMLYGYNKFAKCDHIQYRALFPRSA